MRKFLSLFLIFVIFSWFLIQENVYAASGFEGMGFGVGVSLTLDNGDEGRVNDAILDQNGVVRVSEESNDIPRVMLESHYFFTPDAEFLSLTSLPKGTWGVGPFVALQPGTDEIIEAIGMGVMFGFKRGTAAAKGSTAWNIGFGAIVDPKVKILGDGIIENQALPTGETQIRFKETSQWGWLIIASFNF